MTVQRQRRQEPATLAAAVRVLDEDPDLGAELTGTRLADAREQLRARVLCEPAGPWPDRLQRVGPGPIGLLVLEGVLARELLMEDNVSAELLGQGDLIRPWRPSGPSTLLRSEVRWTLLEPTRFAVLGRSFATAVANYPEVNTVLLDRVTDRAHRLALTQAISQLNGVERRVLTLFWHLAERWGRVASSGVIMPLALPHRVVAHLVGARRPTVSTALGRLRESGAIERRLDGSWILHGEPAGLPTEATARVVRFRRRPAQVV